MDLRQGAKKAKDGAIRLKDSVVDGVGKRIDTVTGKSVIEEVIKFAQETDAVNTAIVTRIYQILDRQAELEKAIKRMRNCLIVILVCFFVAIAYIWQRGK
jgi:glycerol-3-phosphate dehydrogenase